MPPLISIFGEKLGGGGMTRYNKKLKKIKVIGGEGMTKGVGHDSILYGI